MNAPVESQPVRSRAQVWILVGIFFVPLLIAFFLYYGLDGWRPAGSTNRGDLITPAIPLPEVALPAGNANESSAELPANILRGKWTMLYVGDGACDQRCREALTLMRQSRLALAEKMERVQRVFLISGNCCDHAYLQAEHPDLLLGRIDNDAGKTLLEPFPEGVTTIQSGRIYLVDPLGNLMMSYAAGSPPKGLLEDMKKLLKLSHIG